MDVFLEDENARKVSWAVPVSKMSVTGLATSTSSWDF